MEIHFRRAPEAAWVNIEGERWEERPAKGGAALYRLVARLARAGFEGVPFQAHDGRMICLRGTISLKAVPVRYGGLQNAPESPQNRAEGVSGYPSAPEAVGVWL